MLVVHGTKKFLDRVGSPTAIPEDVSSTNLGSWYATVLFWRSQVALFVNEETLLPMLLPLAPAASVLDRFGPGLEILLSAHGVAAPFIAAEMTEVDRCLLAKTNNRSVVGIMNEFAYLGNVFRHSTDAVDLQDLSLRLAETPCSPLYNRHVTPHDELLARAAGSEMIHRRPLNNLEPQPREPEPSTAGFKRRYACGHDQTPDH